MPAMRATGEGDVLVRRGFEQRKVVLAAALALFAAVFAVGQAREGSADAITLLYVVPIALVALELGLWAGVGAAALALGLLGVREWTGHIDLTVLGFLTRATAFAAVGAIAGRFSDRMRRAHLRHGRLLASGLELAHLADAEQLPTTVARGARQLVGADGAEVVMAGEDRLVDGASSTPSASIPIAVRGVRHGTLTVTRRRSLDPEEQATLALLALQAAVAAENQELLAAARERAAMRAELQNAHSRLDERARQLRTLLDRQEDERRQVADELHEEAAQMLAAVLMGLGALESDLDSELGGRQLEEVRSDVDSTLRGLRALAASLRPRVLDLGLVAALEHLATVHDGATGPPAVSIEIEDVSGIHPEAQTMIYRIVEEAMKATGPVSGLELRGGGAAELAVRLRFDGPRPTPDQLAILQARLDLLRGSLTVEDGALVVAVPLP